MKSASMLAATVAAYSMDETEPGLISLSSNPETEFLLWASYHQKDYKTKEEFDMRKELYQRAVAQVANLNL